MKAVVVHGPGDLRVEEHPDPQPAPGEALLAVQWGGVCGSDLSYAQHGASGTAALKHPLTLGHEVSGTVTDCGEGVPETLMGKRVAVQPASFPERHPRHGRPLAANEPHLRYLGSAAHHPHTDGGFRQLMTIGADQVYVLPENVSTRTGALIEPLAVALHAVRRAEGSLGGELAKHLSSHDSPTLRPDAVLVNGCGPIGLLLIAVLRHLGVKQIIAADLSAGRLRLAEQVGAHHTRDAHQPLDVDARLTFEASGAPAAIAGVLASTVRGGTVVQVGNLPAGPAPVALGQLISREINWIGSYRFATEFPDAIQLLNDGLNIEQVITHQFPLEQASQAFSAATDAAGVAGKVLLSLSPDPVAT